MSDLTKENMFKLIDEGVREGIGRAIEENRRANAAAFVLKDPILVNIKNKINTLEVENNEKISEQLASIMLDIYRHFIKKQKSLNDWQKVKFADAIMAWQLNWFYLSRFSLLLVLEPAENISETVRYVDPLHKAASSIDLNALLNQLNR